ncbi:MAG: hypothetical protein GZ091_09360 [Paludibacter sp.]|nr:hypothetical protein [Paludibacter sp.]
MINQITLNSGWHFVKGDNRSALYPENGTVLNGFRIGSDKAINNTEKEGIYKLNVLG